MAHRHENSPYCQDLIRAISSGAQRLMRSPFVSWAAAVAKDVLDGKGADEFGMDAAFADLVRPIFDFLYLHYFRVRSTGIGNVPARGPAIFVANHAGALPYDGAMVHMAVHEATRGARGVRFLVDDFAYDLPFIGTIIQRLGGVRASQENAARLIGAGHLIVAFPEGVAGIGKSYDERYRLRRFGRGGFVRLAMRTRAPIIPVSIIGSEEVHPIIWKSRRFAEPLGLPFVPFTPTFPWLGPLGLVPLPSKWKIVFGKPVSFKKYSARDADKERLVQAMADRIKETIQLTLDRELARRKSVWI
ncbi:MAG: acyltransferase family protein [Proteobacteria bacterium]|nr:acyltransferase family protein [Pseudomonadota bacterium]